MAKKKITLNDGEVAIIGNKTFINWLVVSAFRYCVNRHQTQAMYGVGDVMLDNLEVINTEFIRQFIRDIEREQEHTEFGHNYNKKRVLDYFEGLKGLIEDAQRVLKDEKGEEHQKLLQMLNEVMEQIPKADMSHHFEGWKLFDNPDTTYLNPMLNRLKAELEKREDR